MSTLTADEIQQVARKIMDKPSSLKILADIIDYIARENGFESLDDEDLIALIHAIFIHNKDRALIVFAGAGAQCCNCG